MGIGAFRHAGWPETKFIDEFGVGDKTAETTSRRPTSVIYKQTSKGFYVPSSVPRQLMEHDVMWCGRPTPVCSDRLRFIQTAYDVVLI
jgi:hypothetical protein